MVEYKCLFCRVVVVGANALGERGRVCGSCRPRYRRYAQTIRRYTKRMAKQRVVRTARRLKRIKEGGAP